MATPSMQKLPTGNGPVGPEEFEVAWYLARYPDIAAAGINPLRHYQEHGWQEKRSPNPHYEPRGAWATRFDRNWYASHYADVPTSGLEPLEHFIHRGILEGRFPNQVEAGRASYAATFDAEWYLARNPDVAKSGVDPLTHYVSQGILEDRRPNPHVLLEHSAVTDARIDCLKEPTKFTNVSLFVAHSPDGNLKPHVGEYLRALKENGVSTILIVAADQDLNPVPERVAEDVSGIYVRENVGFDFSAWAHVLHLRPEIWDADILYFMNDSVMGPINSRDFKNMMNEVVESAADMIGLTENVDRGWHLQSYFLAFKRRALRSKAMRKFVANIVSYKGKNDVVNEYETRFAAELRRAGLKCVALFSKPGVSNPTLYYWQEMLSAGYPFVKVSTIRGDTETVDASQWRSILSNYGYETSTADRTLSEFWRSVKPAGQTLSAMEQRVRLRSLAELHDYLSDKISLRMSPAEAPDLSIVLINRNNAHNLFYTLNTLSTPSQLKAEYIVVDDASIDSSIALLESTQGVTVVRNSESIGFLRSANRGASRCRGGAVLFLSADARVTPEALNIALKALLESYAGAVSAKICRLDRRLANAGSIVWNDGSSMNFGADREADEAEFSFARDVDACALPFIMADRGLFDSTGRFDPSFNAAQSGVVELCTRIRAAGRRILYVPSVEVVSLDSLRLSLDDFHGQEADRKRIVSLHGPELAKRHFDKTTTPLWARQSSPSAQRLLVLGDSLPQASGSGLHSRAAATVEACREAGYTVSFFPARHAGLDLGGSQSVLPDDVELLIRSSPIDLETLLHERKSFYQLIYVLGRQNMVRLAQHFHENPEQYLGVKIVYDLVSLVGHPLRGEHGSLTWKSGIERKLHDDIELAKVADVLITDNSADARFFTDSGSPRVQVLGPVLQPATDRPGFDQRKDILFLARLDSDDSPGLKALFDFVEEIMPILDQAIGPNYRLNVVGPAGSRRLQAFRHPRVVVHGAMDDLSESMDDARILIESLPSIESGVSSAIYEAAARGLPTVVSQQVSRQIHGEIGSALLVGDTFEAMGRICAEVYSDEKLWNKTRERAMKIAESGASVDTFKVQALEMLQRLQPFSNKENLKRPALQDLNFTKASRTKTASAAENKAEGPLLEKNKLSGDIAVIYLARGAGENATESFERFLSSYKKFSSGVDHDLFVILKGYKNVEALEAAEALFAGVGARSIHLPDEGFDLGAYVAAARDIRNEQLCFLNTNAEILCDDWLYHMALRLRRTDVGMVGATGSFEALETFEGQLRFPNVHLRSNAFLISRRLFRSIMDTKVFHTKEDAYAAENGPASLTRQVLGRGFEVLIVGRNGRSYPPTWWPSSNTFRQGSQDNLIVGDNQTRLFDDADDATKEWLCRRAWGELVDMRDFNQ